MFMRYNSKQTGVLVFNEGNILRRIEPLMPKQSGPHVISYSDEYNVVKV